MEKVFQQIINSRKVFIQLVDSLSIEQLNEIPEGFNNNIAWNFGHIVVSTQGLCYLRTEVEPNHDIKYISNYAKGTKPTYTVSQEEIDELKVIALASIEQIKSDYEKGTFAETTPFATSTYEVTLNTIEDVLITTISHDSLHHGYALAQKKNIITLK